MSKKPSTSRSRKTIVKKAPAAKPKKRAKPKRIPIGKKLAGVAVPKTAAVAAAKAAHATARDLAQAKAREFAIAAARLLSDDKCDEVVIFDLTGGLSQTQDFIVLASGTSDRQMRSCADDLGKLAQTHGYRLFRRSADNNATWVVADFVDVVAHVFEPNTRAYYDLETLWGDAPKVEWAKGRKPAKKLSTEPQDA